MSYNYSHEDFLRAAETRVVIMRRISAHCSAPSLAAIAALLLLATLYFALGNGIVSTNDGSHYALTKALAAT